MLSEALNIKYLGMRLEEVIVGASQIFTELWLMMFILIMLVVDLLTRNAENKAVSISSWVGIVGIFILTLYQWNTYSSPQEIFNNMLVVDGLSIFTKIIFSITGLLVLVFITRNEKLNLKPIGEFHVFILGILLGAYFLVMSKHLLITYLSIEMISICSYILTQFHFNKRSAESGIKYLVFGAVSSGIMLYGMSWVYGLTGSLEISSHFFVELFNTDGEIILIGALMMTLAGVLFKIALVPFHIWAPDVYQGTPLAVVALLSVVPKIAGLIVLVRVIAELPQISIQLRHILIFVSILSIIVGNFSALWQKSAKRMMAYSSIAHAGILLIGIIAYTEYGIKSMVFYCAVYMLMNFMTFMLIGIIGRDNIEEMRGIGMEKPVLGIFVIIAMISLTGLPPTGGFSAKFLIFSSLWDAWQVSNDHTIFTLFVVGLFSTVVSLFYYLKIPYFMFFKKSVKGESNDIKISLFEEISLVGLSFGLLITFFRMDWLLEFVNCINFIL